MKYDKFAQTRRRKEPRTQGDRKYGHGGEEEKLYRMKKERNGNITRRHYGRLGYVSIALFLPHSAARFLSLPFSVPPSPTWLTHPKTLKLHYTLTLHSSLPLPQAQPQSSLGYYLPTVPTLPTKARLPDQILLSTLGYLSLSPILISPLFYLSSLGPPLTPHQGSILLTTHCLSPRHIIHSSR